MNMDALMDTLETAAHLVITAGSVALTNWHSIGGGILMAMQGVYLYRKLKAK